MAFEYVETEDAIAKGGLRMVVVGKVPSPWGEAAKGLFHMKGLDWTAVRLAYDDPRQADWIKCASGPVAVYEDEPPRSGWAEILFLAERLAPEPAMLPADPAARAEAFGLAHELLGEQGLAWSRRLQLVAAGLKGEGGFPEPVAGYLANKYGFTPEAAETCAARVRDLLGLFASKLKARAADGRSYYHGERPGAVDVYSACVMALFAPLPEDVCAMRETTRAAFETIDAETKAALDPILLEHRDHMYTEHLETPLNL